MNNYPTLMIDPKRSFEGFSPKTVPQTIRPFGQSDCNVKFLP